MTSDFSGVAIYGSATTNCSENSDNVYAGNSTRCSMCKSWFHCTCINLFSVANYKNRKWYSVKCNVLMS